MHVLEVVEACSAGVGRHVSGLCEGLVAQDHRVTVVYSPRRTDDRFRQFVKECRTEIRFVPVEVRREVSPASDLRGLAKLISLISSEEPFDLVHGHSSKAGAIARIAGRVCGIPTVYTPNGLITSSPEISRLEAMIYTRIERFLGHWATSRIIAVAEEERDSILKLKLVPRDLVALVENGIEEQDFEGFSDKHVHKNLDEAPLTFGTAIRFSAQKAPENLVEAFIRLHEALPQVPMRLVIAGHGELFGGVRRQVEKSGISDKISLLGWKPDTKEVLRDLDVFVLPSLYEGFSYSTLEAMAAQLPVVSTNVSGARGMLSRVPHNILVPVGAPDALAEGMKQMATLSDPKTLRRSLYDIGKNNRSYVRSRFMQSEVTRRTLGIYRTLCRLDR